MWSCPASASQPPYFRGWWDIPSPWKQWLAPCGLPESAGSLPWRPGTLNVSMCSEASLGSWPILFHDGQFHSNVDFWYLLLANSGAQSPLLIRFLLLPLIRSVLNNMHEMEQMLLKTEDINWTVVRPPGLRNLSFSGRLGNSSCFLVSHRKTTLVFKPW